MLLNERIDDFKPDNLLFDGKFSPDIKTIEIDAGEGELKRGSVMSTSDNKTFKLMDAGEKPDCILADDIDATNAVIGSAYRTGHFNSNAVICKGNYTLDENDEAVLRNHGIFFSTSVSVSDAMI